MQDITVVDLDRNLIRISSKRRNDPKFPLHFRKKLLSNLSKVCKLNQSMNINVEIAFPNGKFIPYGPTVNNIRPQGHLAFAPIGNHSSASFHSHCLNEDVEPLLQIESLKLPVFSTSSSSGRSSPARSIPSPRSNISTIEHTEARPHSCDYILETNGNECLYYGISYGHCFHPIDPESEGCFICMYQNGINQSDDKTILSCDCK